MTRNTNRNADTDRETPTNQEIGNDLIHNNAPVGPPDGWIAAADDPKAPPDPRYPAPRTPNGPDTDNRTRVTIPVKKIGTPGVTNTHLKEYGITRNEAAFMRAVVKAMNRNLEGYELTDSMADISTYYDIDEEKLMESGFLKKHTMSDRRSYYTVTWDGQEACRLTKQHGREIGDVGADTPHRVGIDLARKYYESQPSTQFVELSTRESGGETDLVVVNNDGNREAIVEVEGGRVSADPTVEDNPRTGIQNYDSVRKDFSLMADSDGDAVWVVRNHEIAADVLNGLRTWDDLAFDIPKNVVERITRHKLKLDTFQETFSDDLDDLDGIDEILTFKQLRLRLRRQ